MLLFYKFSLDYMTQKKREQITSFTLWRYWG